MPASPIPTAWYTADGDVFGHAPGQGLWRLCDGNWTWLAHGTDGWNGWHRQLFEAMEGRPLPGPPADAPPLPPSVPETVPEDRDAVGALARSEALIAWVGAGRTVWVVLQEDLYESQFGDGTFHDLVACVPTKAEAEAVPVAGERHLRRLTLRVDRGRGEVVGEAERTHSADRYRVADALALLTLR